MSTITFAALTSSYRTITSTITLEAAYPGKSLEQQVLLHKLTKHASNSRKCALYLSLFMNGGFELPEEARIKARGLKLKALRRGKTFLVGYPHEDGTYHYF